MARSGSISVSVSIPPASLRRMRESLRRLRESFRDQDRFQRVVIAGQVLPRGHRTARALARRYPDARDVQLELVSCDNDGFTANIIKPEQVRYVSFAGFATAWGDDQ